MRVHVDMSLCQATALCTGLAPEVFDFDEDGQLLLLLAEPPESERAAVLQAVNNCPVAAIRVEQ